MTDDRESADPDGAEPTPAERAAADAAKAAKKARKAQEKADRLAAEAARLAARRRARGDDRPGARRHRRPSRVPVLGAIGLLVACVAFLVVGVVVHVRDSGPAPCTGEHAFAMRRLLAARQDIVVLNSLDYRNLDQGLGRWLAASTGTLHSSFEHITAADRKRITDAKSVTTARIVEAAVVSLDAANGSATVIASVELTVTPPSGKAVIKRERQQADVTRVGGVWKISALQQVGVTVQ